MTILSLSDLWFFKLTKYLVIDLSVLKNRIYARNTNDTDDTEKHDEKRVSTDQL